MIPPLPPDINARPVDERVHIEELPTSRLALLTMALEQLQDCQAYLSGLRETDHAEIEYHLQLREA